MKIRRIASMRTSIVGKYEVVVTLSDGSKLDDVISMEVDWPSAGGPMITLKMLGDDKLEIEPPQKCEHDWDEIMEVRNSIPVVRKGERRFRCMRCGATEICIKPYCGPTEIRVKQCDHLWLNTDMPKIDGTHIAKCPRCGVHR